MADRDSQSPLFTLTEAPPPRDAHVVSAHTRVLHDGSETFVGEHWRWNRGETTRTRAKRRPPPPDPSQLGLFFKD